MKKIGEASNTSSDSGSVSVPTKRMRNETDDEEIIDVDSNVFNRNQPVIMAVYVEPETNQEKLSIIATAPSGAENIAFSLVGSGPGSSSAQITYDWAKILYNVDVIFEKSIKDGSLPKCHPKLMAIRKELENNRQSIDDIPRGVIELNLPIPVQTATDSIKIQGGVKEGCKVIIVDLKAYQHSYSVKQSDKVVKFEDL